MNRSELSLRGALATSLALLAVTACGAAPDATEPPSASASSSLAADIARQNAETDGALHLLVRLELSADELFEIYEPAPGQVVISGAGAPRDPVLLPEDVANLTIEEIWRRVAGTRPMPESLIAALRRTTVTFGGPGTKPPPKLNAAGTAASAGDVGDVGTLGGAGTKPPPKLEAASESASDSVLNGQPGPKPPPKLDATATSVGNSGLLVGPPGPRPPPKLDATATLTVPEAAWCKGDYYELGYGDCLGATADCVDDGSNGRQRSAPNAGGSYSNVCAVEGNVTLEITSGDRYSGTWNVPQNTLRWYRNLQRSPEVGEILNASGERFHFRVGDSRH